MADQQMNSVTNQREKQTLPDPHDSRYLKVHGVGTGILMVLPGDGDKDGPSPLESKGALVR